MSCLAMLLCSHLTSLYTGRWSSQNYVKRLRRTVRSPATLRVYKRALYMRTIIKMSHTSAVDLPLMSLLHIPLQSSVLNMVTPMTHCGRCLSHYVGQNQDFPSDYFITRCLRGLGATSVRSNSALTSNCEPTYFQSILMAEQI